MKSQEAQRLIKQTFENPFNKTQFIHFINNLLKDEYEEKSFIQTGAHLPDAFSTYIRKMERIGKYEDATGNFIDILMVELKRDHSIEYARTAQRNFIRRYLNGSRGGELKDAAIVAFYTEGSEDWRFSLIKMQYSLEKKKDELTPAKRFSFLVGKNEKSHTAQKQLAGLLTMDKVPVLADIENAFNIETVTHEFFEKYKELFHHLSDFFEKQLHKNRELRIELTAKNIDHISFTKKLLGQIVFLYFLQKKGWLGVDKNGKWGEGDKKFLRSLLEKATSAKKNYYTDYLQYLFYEALAEERRNAADPSYYRPLDCKIPFLNGGLFEADYDWKNITVKIPNDFFFNENITKEGDTGDGILNVFDRYNFTVKEDEPLDKEVAVDPEMLGKVFEKLLEVKDRKSKGAFYTPREIVHYMCQESLVNYLDTTFNNEPAAYQKLGTAQTDLFGNKVRKGQLALEAELGATIKVPKPDLEKFIREGNSAIDNDARVGKAGRETVRYSYHLPESIRTYAAEIDKALADIRVCDPAIGSGAFPVGIMNEIVKAREILTTYLPLKKQKVRTAYEFKRHCIQESIYGVDIDHSAIDIAKLRLWLSLVVDEQDLSTVKPLPNLDYKIVWGNSLIGMPEGSFRNAKLEDEIQVLKEELFNETNKPTKDKLREKINKKIRQLLDSAEQFAGYKIDFDFKVFFSEVFHEKKGFDVVIGNPPYVRQENITDIKHILKLNYDSFDGRADLYVFFYELSLQLLGNNGTIAFISSNKFFRSKYGSPLRKFISDTCSVRSIIDFGELPVFETASTFPMVFIAKKSKGIKSSFNYTQVKSLDPPYPDIGLLIKESGFNLPSNAIDGSSWKLASDNSVRLLEKISLNKKTLKELYGSNIYSGIKTGLNKAFWIDDNIRKELIKEDKSSSKLIKRLSRGDDIRKWHIRNSGLYIIYTPQNIEITQFPAVKKYLHQFKSTLESRAVKQPWWQLQQAQNRNRIWDNPKIVYPDICKESRFTIDTEGIYVDMKGFIIPTSDYFILGVLNSKLIWWFLKRVCAVLGDPDSGGRLQLKRQYVELIPIQNASEKVSKSITSLVQKCIESKKIDHTSNISKAERQLDIMVYHLYSLTYEEAKIIDPELSAEEFEKYKL